MPTAALGGRVLTTEHPAGTCLRGAVVVLCPRPGDGALPQPVIKRSSPEGPGRGDRNAGTEGATVRLWVGRALAVSRRMLTADP